MASCPDDFPFGIMDVVELLQVRVRRRSPEGIYADCPFCADRKGRFSRVTSRTTVLVSALITSWEIRPSI